MICGVACVSVLLDEIRVSPPFMSVCCPQGRCVALIGNGGGEIVRRCVLGTVQGRVLLFGSAARKVVPARGGALSKIRQSSGQRDFRRRALTHQEGHALSDT